MSKTKKLNFITICRWLPQNKKSPNFFSLKRAYFTRVYWEDANIQRCYINTSMRSSCWCLMVKFPPSYLLPLMPANPLVLLNWLNVLLSMQCNCFLLNGCFNDTGPHCRCNACNHVFVDESKWLWFSIIPLPMCSVCLFSPVENSSSLNQEKNLPPCCLCCLLMSFSRRVS